MNSAWMSLSLQRLGRNCSFNLALMLVDEPLNGIFKERYHVALRLAGQGQHAVVFGPCLIVVVAEKVCCDRRHAGGEQNLKLDQPRRPAVSVAKRVEKADHDWSTSGW